MKLRPLRDQVLVRRFESETTTSGGIVLPGKAEKTNRGEVVAAGAGRIDNNGNLIELAVKVGDKVVFGGYHSDSNTIKIDGVEHVLMSESDILAVIEAE
ncbi:co-chaperone GroES [Parendozoicomonas haliclonae]|uniref:Co-chaperonin GroES n=1 Tax=Parendozoicomonas haliclonae TaxID=1960125 RepID=A0A1X7AEM3_9GAMM|nr:co-chaperone GroES [Parendozoicomonas haliclonae]SMA34916.1 10 kDa chaperonin [Parendozoicomonas haliclonae]